MNTFVLVFTILPCVDCWQIFGTFEAEKDAEEAKEFLGKITDPDFVLIDIQEVPHWNEFKCLSGFQDETRFIGNAISIIDDKHLIL